MRTKADSPTKTCTHDECDRPMRAKELCVTHYNQQQPGRHKKVSVTCDGCGAEVWKDHTGRRRYASARCSELCRHWIHWGAWSVTLPHDHPALPQAARRPQPKRLEYREIECAWCGTRAGTMRRTTRFCSVRCKGKAKSARRRAREVNAPGEYTWAQVVQLWSALDRCCAYCHKRTPLVDIQAEHVTPLSRGGRNDIGNILPSCGPCNADKRDLLLHEWSADRERRRLPPVHTMWSTHDARYSHLIQGTQDLAA